MNWQARVYGIGKTQEDRWNDGCEWRSLRWKVLSRDRFTCQRCGDKFPHGHGLTAHHIRARANGGADLIDNLTSLCNPCHDLVECLGSPTLAAIQGASFDDLVSADLSPLVGVGCVPSQRVALGWADHTIPAMMVDPLNVSVVEIVGRYERNAPAVQLKRTYRDRARELLTHCPNMTAVELWRELGCGRGYAVTLKKTFGVHVPEKRPGIDWSAAISGAAQAGCPGLIKQRRKPERIKHCPVCDLVQKGSLSNHMARMHSLHDSDNPLQGTLVTKETHKAFLVRLEFAKSMLAE